MYLNNVSNILSQHNLRSKLITALNSDNLSEDLKRVMEDTATTATVSYDCTDSLEDGDEGVRSHIGTGVYEVDEITHNFVGGSVATIAAFTGHAKSSTCVSATYRAMKEDQHCAYFSLELPRATVLKQFFVRSLYE